MIILDFVRTYLWDIIAIIIVFSAAIIMYVKDWDKKLLNNIILKLVVEAEKYLGSGTGTLKKKYVLSTLYEKMPFIVRTILPMEKIDKLIESNVSELRDFLKNGGDISDYDIKTNVKLTVEPVMSTLESTVEDSSVVTTNSTDNNTNN